MCLPNILIYSSLHVPILICILMAIVELLFLHHLLPSYRRYCYTQLTVYSNRFSVIGILEQSDLDAKKYWSAYRSIIFTRMFEPRHNILSNVRTNVRKYILACLEHSRESNSPVSCRSLTQLSIIIIFRSAITASPQPHRFQSERSREIFPQVS